MSRLQNIFRSKNINFCTKYLLFKSLVVSVLLYGCEAWTLLAEDERRFQAFEFKCLKKLMGITYLERKTNDYVRDRFTSLVGPHDPLLAIVKRQKLQWFGHVTRHNTLSKTILQDTVEGGRRRGHQRKSWTINLKEWTDRPWPQLFKTAQDRDQWRALSATSSLMSPRRPNRLRD